jgi:hypothetical protein
MAIKRFRRETLYFSIFLWTLRPSVPGTGGLPVTFTPLANLCPGFRFEIDLIDPQNGIKSHSLASLQSSLDAKT